MKGVFSFLLGAVVETKSGSLALLFVRGAERPSTSHQLDLVEISFSLVGSASDRIGNGLECPLSCSMEQRTEKVKSRQWFYSSLLTVKRIEDRRVATACFTLNCARFVHAHRGVESTVGAAPRPPRAPSPTGAASSKCIQRKHFGPARAARLFRRRHRRQLWRPWEAALYRVELHVIERLLTLVRCQVPCDFFPIQRLTEKINPCSF